MRRWHRALAAAAGLAVAGYVAATVVAGSGRAAGPVLDASVGPGFTISLTQSGVPVTALAPGAYTIDVSDMASIHNFHLQGPGVDKATSVPGTGSDTWDITLSEGEYSFQCDPHAPYMNGSFSVMTAPTTSTATTTTATPTSTTTTGTTTTAATTATAPATSTTTNAPAAVTHATAPLVQSVRVQVPRPRVVVVHVDLSRPATVRARLLRRGRALAVARRRVGTKPTVLTLHVPRAAKAGRYKVEVVAGGRRILRTVVLRG